jgi:hypothetical protein
MTLYRYDGKLLRGPDGGLAGNENCCCGEPPADCCCNCDLSNASITDLDITDGGTRYRLIGGPYALSNNPLNPCEWTIGIQVHGSGSSSGSLELSYCQNGVTGWYLQGFNTTAWIENNDGPCTGQIDVTKAGATGFITIEGGVPCCDIIDLITVSTSFIPLFPGEDPFSILTIEINFPCQGCPGDDTFPVIDGDFFVVYLLCDGETEEIAIWEPADAPCTTQSDQQVDWPCDTDGGVVRFVGVFAGLPFEFTVRVDR